MTLNNSHEAVIAERRETVASLLLAGHTQREIAARCIDPSTGQSVSAATINSDVRAIKAEWRKSAREKVEAHVASQSARLEDIIKSLWPKRDNPRTAEVILQALKRQAELFGTDKPTKQEHSGPNGGPIQVSAIDYRTAIAPLAPGPMGDSDPSGEGEMPGNGQALGKNGARR